MKILGTSISRERFALVCLLFVMNVVTIAARSAYLQRVPTWVYVLNGGLLAAAVVVSLIDFRKSKGQSNTSERT